MKIIARTQDRGALKRLSRKTLHFGAVLAGGALLAACGSTRGDVTESGLPAPTPVTGTVQEFKGGTFKVGKPYKIRGKWYKPEADWAYDEKGEASWYGDKFHGRKTANGEVFNMHAMSAAHPTLPMPSMVRVTNLENGKSVDLRVNDRGPFAHNRIIDVSKRAAKELGFYRQGRTQVRVQILGQAPLEVRVAAAPVKKPAKIRRKERETKIAAADLPMPKVAAAGFTPSSAALGRMSDLIRDAMLPDVPPADAAAQAEPVLVAANGDENLDALEDVIRRAEERRRKEEEKRRKKALPPLPPTMPRSVAAGPSAPAGQTPNPTTSLPQAEPIYIQIGAFRLARNAEEVVAELSARFGDLGAPVVTPVTVNGSELHRVRIGPLSDADQAERAVRDLIGSGYRDSKLVYERPAPAAGGVARE